MVPVTTITIDHAVSSFSSSENDNKITHTNSRCDVFKNAKPGITRGSENEVRNNIIERADFEEIGSVEILWKVEKASRKPQHVILQSIVGLLSIMFDLKTLLRAW